MIVDGGTSSILSGMEVPGVSIDDLFEDCCVLSICDDLILLLGEEF